MSAPKFTRGPWEVQEVDAIASPPASAVVLSSGGKFGVASCFSIDDARLIGTAPELYDALAGVMADLNCLDGDLCPHWVASHAKARSVLAKARGEA